MTSNDTSPKREFDRQPGYPMSFRRAEKRVQVVFGGTTIVDSSRAMVMDEDGHASVYYFDRDEVRMDLLQRTPHSTR